MTYLIKFRTDPAAARRETMKQKRLSVCKQNHAKENLRIFACVMYICVGKYMVRGQNEMAPRRPTKALKKGNMNPTITVNITYPVLHSSLKKLNSQHPRMLYSAVMNLLSGHLLRLHLSTNANTGSNEVDSFACISKVNKPVWFKEAMIIS
nr:hypothetical protein AXF42_Ash011270 [Ipomoea batatas]GMC89611.1 hypothetical protein AXF42_Ash011270 [Ipomoea batatas]